MEWIERPGIILHTEHYEACVSFYRDTLKLSVEWERPELTTFGFGSGYLMVERGGSASPTVKTRTQSPVTLRFNVVDVEATAADLRERGVAVEVRRWDWGITGHFQDPDGNRCELKDPFR
jgi:lactoylglutathione lyase